MKLNDDDHSLCLLTIGAVVLFGLMTICGTIRDVLVAKYQGNSQEIPSVPVKDAEQQTQVPATKPLTLENETP